MSDAAPRRLVRAESVLQARHRRMTLVLEDAHDAHNVSAVLRTCEALGIQDVHLVVQRNESAEIHAAVTGGAHRWLTLHRHYGAAKAVAALRRAGYAIYAGMLSEKAVPLPQLPRQTRAAYVFGNEHAGLSSTWSREADADFVIPTTGFGGSLNLSVAAALTIYDRLLGKAAAEPPQGDLTDAEKHALREQWYEMLAHGSSELAQQYRRWLRHPPEPRSLFPVDLHRAPER